MKKALFYTVMFAFIQIVASTIVPLVWKWVNGGDALHNATVMILTMALFSLVTLVVFLGAKWCEVSPHWIRTRPWFVLFWCVVAALGALVPSSWIQEQMPALPNVIEEELDTMEQQALGGYRHLCRPFCTDPHESGSDAACLPYRTVAGMDVLSYRQYCSGSGVSLGE